MAIKLSDHFTYRKILRFTLPSIIMMIFTSIYGVVDGYFVSNYVGKTPFAALNFIMPVLMILGSLGFMYGAGGSALVSKTFGEGKPQKANRLFSAIICFAFVTGVIISVIGIIFTRPIAKAMGAEGELLEYSVLYGYILLASNPFYILQMAFQTFFVTAEKPKLGLGMTVMSGVINMVLDWLFVAVFKWGLAGAAWATTIGQLAGGIVPVIYFLRPNSSILRLIKPDFDFKAILKVCTNGSSEFMNCMASSLVGILYNLRLMQYAGENGIAAYGVIMYVNFIFVGVFIGYASGIAPVQSYHFGAQNANELKNLLKKSLTVVGTLSVIMLTMAVVLSKPLAMIFVSYDKVLFDMTVRGFVIFAFSFLFSGFGIYSSAFFTSLNNGGVSAAIAVLRTLVFQVGAILLLPLIFELDGVWLSVAVSEMLAVAVSVVFLIKLKNKYKYF